MMIKTILNSNSVVLYWDLPENYVKGNKYIIYIDGKIAGETEKCHFILKTRRRNSRRFLFV